jgi:hypothetical protein
MNRTNERSEKAGRSDGSKSGKKQGAAQLLQEKLRQSAKKKREDRIRQLDENPLFAEASEQSFGMMGLGVGAEANSPSVNVGQERAGAVAEPDDSEGPRVKSISLRTRKGPARVQADDHLLSGADRFDLGLGDGIECGDLEESETLRFGSDSVDAEEPTRGEIVEECLDLGQSETLQLTNSDTGMHSAGEQALLMSSPAEALGGSPVREPDVTTQSRSVPVKESEDRRGTSDLQEVSVPVGDTVVREVESRNAGPDHTKTSQPSVGNTNSSSGLSVPQWDLHAAMVLSVSYDWEVDWEMDPIEVLQLVSSRMNIRNVYLASGFTKLYIKSRQERRICFRFDRRGLQDFLGTNSNQTTTRFLEEGQTLRLFEKRVVNFRKGDLEPGTYVFLRFPWKEQ